MSSLCDFSDPDILVNRTITVTGTKMIQQKGKGTKKIKN